MKKNSIFKPLFFFATGSYILSFGSESAGTLTRGKDHFSHEQVKEAILEVLPYQSELLRWLMISEDQLAAKALNLERLSKKHPSVRCEDWGKTGSEFIQTGASTNGVPKSIAVAFCKVEQFNRRYQEALLGGI